jgi:hypothetical protein
LKKENSSRVFHFCRLKKEKLSTGIKDKDLNKKHDMCNQEEEIVSGSSLAGTVVIN